MPWTVRNYKLDELTTATALRSNLALMFREYAHIKDTRVVDVLIYKGREELEVILQASLREGSVGHCNASCAAFLRGSTRGSERRGWRS